MQALDGEKERIYIRGPILRTADFPDHFDRFPTWYYLAQINPEFEFSPTREIHKDFDNVLLNNDVITFTTADHPKMNCGVGLLSEKMIK